MKTSEISMEQIANRANELTGSMSHGHACFVAVREFGIPSEDVATFAGIVSTMITNRAINPVAEAASDIEKKARIAALIPKHLAAIAAEIEVESAKRGGNWGGAALRALRNGTPRWEQTAEARRRAQAEVEAARE